VLLVHFAVRKRFFESYTIKYGWLVYALCIPAVVISILHLMGGKSWSFWLGGFLFLGYAAFGYWIDYPKNNPVAGSPPQRHHFYLRDPLSGYDHVLLVAAGVIFQAALDCFWCAICNQHHFEPYISLISSLPQLSNLF